MGVPGQRYSVTFKIAVPKPVTCENCGCEYIYEMCREVQGAGESMLWLDNQGAKERAREAAAKAAERAAANGCDVVACPDCGWYQRDMVAKIRLRRFAYLFLMAVVVVAAVGFYGHKQDAENVPDIDAKRAHIYYTVLAVAGFVATVVGGGLFWLRNINANHQDRSEKRAGRPSRATRRARGRT